jgi:hypothetical protein
MDSGTAARLRDVTTLAIDEFHLKIVAPCSGFSFTGAGVRRAASENQRWRSGGKLDCGQAELACPSRPRGALRSSFG